MFMVGSRSLMADQATASAALAAVNGSRNFGVARCKEKIILPMTRTVPQDVKVTLIVPLDVERYARVVLVAPLLGLEHKFPVAALGGQRPLIRHDT
jgi:hypothetical protein